MAEKMTVDNLLGGSKKKAYKNARFMFKVEGLVVDTDVKFVRLDSKKILPFEEYSVDKASGERVKGKKVGFVNGSVQYFKAIKNDKGEYSCGMPVPTDRVEKVVCNKKTGEIKKKDERKGLRFVKVVPMSVMGEWLIEDIYNFWSEENSDSMLRVYEYLLENGMVGVFTFNPYGTAYNGFLVPQRVDGGRFRLLLNLARVRINTPDISPTIMISDATARSREKDRVDSMGSTSALEEV